MDDVSAALVHGHHCHSAAIMPAREDALARLAERERIDEELVRFTRFPSCVLTYTRGATGGSSARCVRGAARPWS